MGNKSADMLKVIFVITTVDGYGADKSIMQNIRYLKTNGLIEPFVVIPQAGKIEAELKELNIVYVVAKFNSWTKGPRLKNFAGPKRFVKRAINYLEAKKAAKFFKDNPMNFDLVYTNTFTTNFGIYLSSFLGIKHVMHIREIPFEQFRFDFEYPEQNLLNFVSKNSVAIFCNSDYTYKYFGQKISGKFIVIANPIFEKKISRIFTKDYAVQKIKFVIAGRYEEAKNQFDAIKAANELVLKGYRNFELCLFGAGPLEKEYKDFIRANQLEHYVVLNSYANNFTDMLTSFDIGLMCSRFEAFGRVTVEYMANGLPVIGNETGNTPFLIKDGVNGLLYKFMDHADLSNKIKHFLDKPDEIKRMGANAIEFLDDNFSLANSSLQILNQFQSLVKS